MASAYRRFPDRADVDAVAKSLIGAYPGNLISFEILLNGISRTPRDRKDAAYQEAMYLKERADWLQYG
jgi:hypothetical protein